MKRMTVITFAVASALAFASNSAFAQDTDGDGVLDLADLCGATVPDVPETRHGKNRWIWNGIDWVTNLPGGTGPSQSFNMAQTQGCGCTQILDDLVARTGFEFDGHYKFGCSGSVMEQWIAGRYYLETVEVPGTAQDLSAPDPCNVLDETDGTAPVFSSTVLAASEDYEIKAYGVYCGRNLITGCAVLVDAEYAFYTSTQGNGTNWRDGDDGTFFLSASPNLADLLVDGGFVNWDDDSTFNANHVYPIVMAGNDDIVEFAMCDPRPSNNVGSLFVDISVALPTMP